MKRLEWSVLIVVLAVCAIFYFHEPRVRQEGKAMMTRFHAEVIANPKKFPEDVVYGVQVIDDYIAKNGRITGKWDDGDNPDIPGMKAALKREATPERIRLFEACMQVGYEQGRIINILRAQNKFDTSRYPEFNRHWDDSIIQYFNPPRIGLRHTPKGKEFYLTAK